MVIAIQKHEFKRSQLSRIEQAIRDHTNFEVLIDDREDGLGHGIIGSNKPRKTLLQRVRSWGKTKEPDYKFACSNGNNYGLQYANLKALYTGLDSCSKIIDSFLDAPDLRNSEDPKKTSEHSIGVIGKVLATYDVKQVKRFVRKIKQYETWGRQTLGEMVLDEGPSLVMTALSSPFSNKIWQYRGALKERLAYEEIKHGGIQKQDLQEIKVSITRACFLWSSKAQAERWDLKGHINDSTGGEIFQIQGHPTALQGFIKSLKAIHGIYTVGVSSLPVSKIYRSLRGDTKPCNC